MREFYYRRPDELYHYGVKGMRWGVRHDPVRTGRQSSGGSRKKMSTAKKVAIGVGVAAAAAGLTYAAVKTGKAKQIAQGAAKLASRNKAKAFSGYELRKMGISTFEPNKMEINRGTQASAARQAYYQRHGKSFVSSNITKAGKIQGYSNKNYTELGRSHYKVAREQNIYENRLKLYKKSAELNPNFNKSRKYPEQAKTQKEILTDMIMESRNRTASARAAEQNAVFRANATKNFKRTKSINYRNLTRRH